jgi:putative addiction module killer protein
MEARTRYQRPWCNGYKEFGSEQLAPNDEGGIHGPRLSSGCKSGFFSQQETDPFFPQDLFCDPLYQSKQPEQDHPLMVRGSSFCVGFLRRNRAKSEIFDAWLSGLSDQKAKARILAHLRSATLGNFGDCKPVGEGVSEMRIHVGVGYRVYYVRTGSTIYVLLVGGDKSSQAKDISRAKNMARELKETNQ